MMTTRCNSIWPLAFHPNISSYGCQWLLQFAPFGIFNLAPKVPGQTGLGPPQIRTNFSSHMAGPNAGGPGLVSFGSGVF